MSLYTSAPVGVRRGVTIAQLIHRQVLSIPIGLHMAPEEVGQVSQTIHRFHLDVPEFHARRDAPEGSTKAEERDAATLAHTSRKLESQ